MSQQNSIVVQVTNALLKKIEEDLTALEQVDADTQSQADEATRQQLTNNIQQSV